MGFLRNIFPERGARFTYAGESQQLGSKVYTFSYVLPLAQSAYRVQAKGAKRPTIPFHGSFSVDGTDYQLTQLGVVADAIPPDLRTCSAETTVTYQIVGIAGRPSLVPASFVLETENEQQVRTVSSSQYSQCREFRGESTIYFRIWRRSACAVCRATEKEYVATRWHLPSDRASHVH